MGFIYKLIMTLILIPVLLIMVLIMFPQKWEKRKYIFGVKVRKVFLDGEAKSFIDNLARRVRKDAFIIIAIGLLINLSQVFINGFFMQTMIFHISFILPIFLLMIPYGKGNTEMKSLKKTLKINSNNTKYVDLKSISSSHALNKKSMMLQLILSFILLGFSLLYDLKIIDVGNSEYRGSFAATIMSASFVFVGVVIFGCANIMDNLRNEVISDNSDINANYNRAKKKLYANVFYLWSILNLVTIIALIINIIFGLSNITTLITIGVYSTLIMVIMIDFFVKERKLENRYKTDENIDEEDDDDDNWILGMFYFNPNDKRLNVEKRSGMGATINMAHPIGRILSVIIAAWLIISMLMVAWFSAEADTPLKVSVNDKQIICSQLKNDYYIDIDDIKEIVLVDNKNLGISRISGTGTDNLCKGNYMIEENKCKAFFNPKVKSLIRINTDKKFYYISLNTTDETNDLYDEIIDTVNK